MTVGSQDASARPRLLLSVDDRWSNGWWFSRVRYLLALRRAGARCRVTSFPRRSHDAASLSQRVGERLEGVDGVVLGGGGDLDPADRGVGPEDFHRYHRVERRRDRFEMELLRQARESQLPILGICRGAQVLNVSTGGTNRPLSLDASPELPIANDDEPAVAMLDHRSRHDHAVDLATGSRLATELGRQRMQVTSWHRHAVSDCGTRVSVAARAEDGVVEAIEVESEPGSSWQPWQIGVQWHPEWMRSDLLQRRLFAAFVRSAAERRTLRLPQENGASAPNGPRSTSVSLRDDRSFSGSS